MDTKAIAQDLHKAEKNVVSVDPLTVVYPRITVEEAYAIQLAGVEIRRTTEGHRVVGKKVGLTSVAMQKLIGVGEPDYGHLLDHMLVMEGESLNRGDLLLPKVEGEVAFILKSTLKGPGITFADVLRATGGKRGRSCRNCLTTFPLSGR